MSDRFSQLAPHARRARPDLWTLGAVIIAVVVLAPILSIVWIAFNPTENIWPHLMATVLPRYLGTTLAADAGVAVLTAAIGTGAAWLVSQYRFPGRRWLALGAAVSDGDSGLCRGLCAGRCAGLCRAVPVRPCGRPSAGPRHATTGSPRSGRCRMAILVLSLALYPYVYLLARAAYREQSGRAYEVARALGCGPWGLFCGSACRWPARPSPPAWRWR